MRSMPSKPWKKVRVQRQSETRYLITVVAPMHDRVNFQEIIEDDLEGCLGKDDTLSEPSWDTKSVVLTTTDFDRFKKKLVYACIQIKRDD